jgi:hemoglobin
MVWRTRPFHTGAWFPVHHRRAPHRHVKITDERRERFVALYLEALDEAGLPDDEAFREAERSHVEFGTRIAQQNSFAETDADLTPFAR